MVFRAPPVPPPSPPPRLSAQTEAARVENGRTQGVWVAGMASVQRGVDAEARTFRSQIQQLELEYASKRTRMQVVVVGG